jgi:hypothetical protein
MAGAATSSTRSALLVEAVNGTIPPTPAFKTMHSAIKMMAKPDIIQGRSLIAGGGRLGRGVQGIDVSGTYEDTLKYGVNDDLLATMLQGVWTANVLKNGAAYTTVSVENTIPAGAGGTPTFLRYRGVEAQSGTLALKARTAANISMELFGIGSDDATTTAIVGATYTNPVDIDPISSGKDVGTITMAGYTLDCMESLDINMAFESRDAQPRIMSDDFCGVTRGDFLPVLNANMYIEANFLAIYNAARGNHTAFAVTVPIGSTTLKKYSILFPKCRFGETEVDMSGASLMQKIQILPEYDAGIGAVMQITRAVV